MYKNQLEEKLKQVFPSKNGFRRMATSLTNECSNLVEIYDLLKYPWKGSIIADRDSYGLDYVKTAKNRVEKNFNREEYLRQFVLIGCSKQKNLGVLPARQKYRGTYWKLKRRYAEKCGDRYWILSSKHGVLHPTQRIGDYDEYIREKTEDEIERWGKTVGDSLEYDRDFWKPSRVKDPGKYNRNYDEIVVLAGQKYIQPIRESLDGLPINVRYPFEDTGGIGEQQGWLKKATEKAKYCRENSYEGSDRQAKLQLNQRSL